jgi:hypothetical protein
MIARSGEPGVMIKSRNQEPLTNEDPKLGKAEKPKLIKWTSNVNIE